MGNYPVMLNFSKSLLNFQSLVNLVVLSKLLVSSKLTSSFEYAFKIPTPHNNPAPNA